MKIALTSTAFAEGKPIPAKYTCQGSDVSPALKWDSPPAGTKSLALICDDPDAPMGTWVHWVLYDIPVRPAIEENTAPGTQGRNDFGILAYGGPCPPSGTHRYFFKLYALDKELNLLEGMSKKDLEAAMKGHILENAELVGLYKKTGKR